MRPREGQGVGWATLCERGVGLWAVGCPPPTEPHVWLQEGTRKTHNIGGNESQNNPVDTGPRWSRTVPSEGQGILEGWFFLSVSITHVT